MKTIYLIILLGVFTSTSFASNVEEDSIDVLNQIVDNQKTLSSNNSRIIRSCAAHIVLKVENTSGIKNLDYSTINAYVLLCTVELIIQKDKRIDNLEITKTSQ